MGEPRANLKACVLAGALLGVSPALSAPAGPSHLEQLEFFESKVRPIFAERCYQCHSDKAEKLKAGLRLDRPDLLLKGGKSGPPIVPGEPEASLLIKAVRYTDPHLKMPPKGKRLSPDEVQNLEIWVKMGAPTPSSPPPTNTHTEMAATRANHWAFQPIGKPALPPVQNPSWPQSPIDYFILALLEKKHLAPAPPADRRTLIRRVTYDLTGLPPTPEEVDDFIQDKDANAYQHLVERLLASPHYGERWGRYWLDVARYADTKGYLAGGEERRYAFSYTYRDYVIAAFNEDKPYDRFITEQLAADLLPLGNNKGPLAALGFLTLGRRFLNNQNDIIDDRIDVVSRGTLALTVSCARCHDHKFDPIPTRDYYSLHGIFASSHEPSELPLLGELPDSPQYQDYLRQKEKIQEEIADFKMKQVEKFRSELRGHIGDYLLGAFEAGKLKQGANLDTFAGEHKLNPLILRRWLDAPRDKPDPIFGPWLQLAAVEDFSSAAPAVIAKLAAQADFNPAITKALIDNVTNSLEQAARAYTRVFKDVDAEWRALLASTNQNKQTPPTQLPDTNREALRLVLYAENGPFNPPSSLIESIEAQPISDGTAPLRNKIEALNWTHPGAPPRAMALVDRPTPANSHVLLRGSPANPAEEVPRRFLEVLSPSNRVPFTNGSGRLELARAITNPDNPLTARVYVNRVWLHHFGEGFVKTPGDFGVRTEEPVHRELLDYLAATFMAHGWSTKELHRLIVMSATYRQSCEASPADQTTDPENNLWSHMNRQRLDFEATRDTLLAVTGKLDPTLGGLPVDIETEPFSIRRTVYGLIDRQNLPGVFRTFDFSNPDTSNQRRFQTTVPQQALFLMNSPFVIEQARRLAQVSQVANAKTNAEKIQALYRLVFQRRPQNAEAILGEKFLSSTSPQGARLTSLEKYAQVLLLSNELMFVD
ncbi:MAG TPA: PSD1 and planctomycete cytochrome C domain-containing protein [Patescibacteria group bacterium]|nr:PSD1 and planctomycete cytochrome C domain-containing protein [Patescibacteria group bacterium]